MKKTVMRRTHLEMWKFGVDYKTKLYFESTTEVFILKSGSVSGSPAFCREIAHEALTVNRTPA